MRARSLFVMFLIAMATVPVGTAAQGTSLQATTGNTVEAVVNNSTLPNETGQVPSSNSTGVGSAAEPIDSLTAIESKRLEDGKMVLRIRSEVPQRITLTDAGAAWTGGEVPQQSYTLQKGTNRVSIPVTEVSGRVGVTIATKRVLYASVITTESPVLTGPFGRDDVQTAALAGLFAGVGVTAIIAFRRVRGTADEPERIL